MIDRLKKTWPARLSLRLAEWGEASLAPALLRRRTLGLALLSILLAALYWGLLASDRYISEARVIVQQTDLSGGQGMDFGSLLGNVGAGNRADQLVLRDYLLSVDMLNLLDAKLDLRHHYSDPSRDLLSRMWSHDVSLEWFQRYHLSRLSVELDDYSGILVIKAQGFDPKTAQAITALLVSEGEAFLNAMGHHLAEGQVSFLEQQVAKMRVRATDARQAVLEFQNRKGLASPMATAENVGAIIARLEGQLTELKTRRIALLGYLVPGSPGVVELDVQIAALENQIAQENGRLVSPKGNNTLNRTVEEYQRLEMEAGFAQDVYKSALGALERGRIEAARMLKKVSVLQAPTRPQLSMEPRRLYNILIFVIFAFMIAGVVHLLAAIIRDHRD